MRLDPLLLLVQDAELAATAVDREVREVVAGLDVAHATPMISMLRTAAWRATRAADFLEHRVGETL